MSNTLEAWLSSIEVVTAIAAVVIAYFVYQLSKNQQVDSWTTALHQLHSSFWSDPDLRDVRAWIASDDAYSNLNVVLLKRLRGRKGLGDDDYLKLEKLDKFFNVLLRARAVAARLRGKQELWSLLYFQYWIDDIIRAGRHNLWTYFQEFYATHAGFLPTTVADADRAVFERECEKRRGKTTEPGCEA